MPDTKTALPSSLNAALLLADGTVFFGEGLGANGTVTGEICFNTAMTGYQEILTDPSYEGQIITFTFPHIGNVGCNDEDVESFDTPLPGLPPQGGKGSLLPSSPLTGEGKGGGGRIKGASGLILREPITEPSNFRAKSHFNGWLERRGITGIAGIDTRALTRHIRLKGAQNAMIISGKSQLVRGKLNEARKKLAAYPSLKGMELANEVTTEKPYEWTAPRWSLTPHPRPLATHYHVVAIDYGVKLNILRALASLGCKITVVPAKTSAEAILKLKPHGIFLSNGPGDPAATGTYALPVIRELMESGIPIFGICLGHQLLGITMGGSTEKMHQGHRGANHPVKDYTTGKVEITSQNHGFVVSETLPEDVEVTHRSLFDGTIQGLRHKTKPIFCVQGHPEASPGPHDSMYLFKRFVEMMSKRIQDSGFGIQAIKREKL